MVTVAYNVASLCYDSTEFFTADDISLLFHCLSNTSLWLPNARPLYFTAVIYLFLYFISTDERPAMGSQPNLASRSEVVSIYKCPQQIWWSSPKFGAQKI